MENVARGVGYFGAITEGAISGWILSTSDAPVDSFALYVDDARIAMAAAVLSPETKLPEQFPPGVLAAFAFEGHGVKLRDFARVEVLACSNRQPVSRISMPYRGDLARVPSPPEHLMMRVTGNANAELVKSAGLRCAGEFLDTLARHRPLDSLRRVLDWGCGCARVTVHLIDMLRPRAWVSVDGCDIDAEAVRWAKANIAGGEFTAIQPYPPLPWPNGTFDAVFACSVFTHLSKELQEAWLEEMIRVIAPGGMLLASIVTTDAPGGFADAVRDPALDGIAPAGYYRGTGQTREYTQEHWSEYFDIAEFIAGGLESSQDLVVMRRRGGPAPAAAVAPAAPAAPAVPVTISRVPVVVATSEAFPPGHFYSPVPAGEDVLRDERRIFRPSPPLHGIELRHDAQLALFHELKRYYAELPYPDAKLRYTFDNPNYGHSDAIVLYSMIRHLRPQRIVEVGSGHSSAVMLDTSERFFDGAIECTFIDPHAELLQSLMTAGDKRRSRVVAKRVQDVPEKTFAELRANDILFVDSTHVLKTGSDVNHLLFEVLPQLASGVYVHIHDVFYPFEYPKSWIVDLKLAWNEAYAVRAFLQYNTQFEIAFFNTYLEQLHPELFHEEMPLCMVNPGGSLWLRKV